MHRKSIILYSKGAFNMNYYMIGQNIRKFRKAYNYSQEELAEKVGISVTHLSHIETGNTKLSLPVFVSLAEVLQVHTDELLVETTSNSTQLDYTKEEILSILDRCTPNELCIIKDIIYTTKSALNKYK